jgi:flagellar hook-length control protein FliK
MIDIATVQNQSPPNAIQSGKLAGPSTLPVEAEGRFSEVIQKELSSAQSRVNSQKSSAAESSWQSKNARTSTQAYQKEDHFDAVKNGTLRESNNRSSQTAATTTTKKEDAEASSSSQLADQNSQDSRNDSSKVETQGTAGADGSVLKNNGKHSTRKSVSSENDQAASSDEKKAETVDCIAYNPAVLNVVQPVEVESSQADSTKDVEAVAAASGDTATTQAASTQEMLFSQLMDVPLTDGTDKVVDSGEAKTEISNVTEPTGKEPVPAASTNGQVEPQTQAIPTSQSPTGDLPVNAVISANAQPASTEKAEKGIALTVKNDKADSAAIDLAGLSVNAPESEQTAVKITAAQSALMDGGNSGLQNENDPNGTGTVAGKTAGSKGQQADAQKVSGSSELDFNGVSVSSTSGQTSSVSANRSVKTADASATPIQQIVQETAASLKAGKSTVHLQLTPQDLGTIDIRLTSDSKGLGITIMTEHASTGRMLESQIENLRQSLSDAGLNLSNLNFSMKDGSSQMGQNQAQTNQENHSNNYSNLFQRSWNSDADAEKSATSTRLSLMQSSIDYLA